MHNTLLPKHFWSTTDILEDWRGGHPGDQFIYGTSTLTPCKRWCICQNIGAAASIFLQNPESVYGVDTTEESSTGESKDMSDQDKALFQESLKSQRNHGEGQQCQLGAEDAYIGDIPESRLLRVNSSSSTKYGKLFECVGEPLRDNHGVERQRLRRQQLLILQTVG